MKLKEVTNCASVLDIVDVTNWQTLAGYDNRNQTTRFIVYEVHSEIRQTLNVERPTCNT